MNPDLERLHPYPFERLAGLLDGITPAAVPAIPLSVGEPRHDAPQFALDAIVAGLRGVEQYPSTSGSRELREAMGKWLCKRFDLGGDLGGELTGEPGSNSGSGICADSQILAVNGTREALFAIAQCLLDRSSNRRQVQMPNPFYQIYEGAALLAGMEPEYYAAAGMDEPDFDTISAASWAATQMLYICNPGNPTGRTLPLETLQKLVNLAELHDFTIVSDECYSEIYRENCGAPAGLLQAAASIGNTAYRHCLVFHSLSKRSNLPGLRSGFVAGDATLIKKFLQYRNYHGCSMPPPIQQASLLAWQDEEHVAANRLAYDEKYTAVLEILQPVLEVERPDAGFYLWPRLPLDDETFTRDMHRLHNVAVVPGSYLAREVNGINPGSNHARLALVAKLDDCVEAASRISDYLQSRQISQ